MTEARLCLHAHQLDIAAITAVHGPGLRLVQLRGRLKCQNCGARQADLHQVYDPGSPLPDHPDRDRLKRRG